MESAVGAQLFKEHFQMYNYEMMTPLLERIEANKIEYERLLKDANYTDVRFNPKNGALSAIHINHNFDPTIGIFGIPRGDYEKISVYVLYEYGNEVILETEIKGENISTPDGFLNGIVFEIKGIEGCGNRVIKDAISKASGQGAEIVVMYFHDKNLYNASLVKNGYERYLINSQSKRVQTVYCVVGRYIYRI